jgi:ABC-type glycerol-3-phosphate transport system substrate-binding protein
MRRSHRLLALSVLALGLAACGERPQELAGRPASVFTVSGWTVGDQGSWQSHMQARAQAQNEHVRLGGSR